ncbi:unnamed protein product [Lepeophtheirus salmonis]|uniref:(salmon louse) hypothetical protein n=1 Tax=Lepeophtheirus salmonis TaxID=72036 RepID=A0A7R8HCS5_LEPSM|nr:unnamed protein product [Lepeophtheirus salmonis]CAF3012006.1 unnamed protein product [Lepeophtheirus salmonis]
MKGKPSEYLEGVRLKGKKLRVSEDIIKHKFLKALPEVIKMATASQVSLPIEAMISHADYLTTLISSGTVSAIGGAIPKKDTCNLLGLAHFSPSQRLVVCRAFLFFREQPTPCRISGKLSGQVATVTSGLPLIKVVTQFNLRQMKHFSLIDRGAAVSVILCKSASIVTSPLQLSAANRASIKKAWITALPQVLLGIRLTPNLNNIYPFTAVTATDMMVSQWLINVSLEKSDHLTYDHLTELAIRFHYMDFQIISEGSCNASKETFIPSALKETEYVWIRGDRVRIYLQAPYIVPAKVISRTCHLYVVGFQNKKKDNVSI